MQSASNYEQVAFDSALVADDSLENDTLLISESCDRRPLRLTRSKQIPDSRLEEESAAYLEGYIQALIDANYYELLVMVHVTEDRVVYLYHLPKDKRIRSSIIAFVKDLPDVRSVREGTDEDPYIKERMREKSTASYYLNGIWFPESTVLFQPLIAEPRNPVYSVAYRWNDRVLARRQVAVSLGDIFPVFRWFDVFPARGDLQIDVAACVWANFNMKPERTPAHEWAELVTTDYLLSVPITYAFDAWSFRLRPYHISSHLGDEFMVNNPDVVRLNPSFEAVDLYTAYQFSVGFRGYFGPGVILNSDRSFPMKYFYFGYGLEWRFAGLRYHYHRLYGAPFIALDVQQWQVNNFTPSLTLQFGYEWSKLQGAGRKVRIFGEYHNGYSEGQFFTDRTSYIAIRGSWGF